MIINFVSPSTRFLFIDKPLMDGNWTWQQRNEKPWRENKKFKLKFACSLAGESNWFFFSGFFTPLFSDVLNNTKTAPNRVQSSFVTVISKFFVIQKFPFAVCEWNKGSNINNQWWSIAWFMRRHSHAVNNIICSISRCLLCDNSEKPGRINWDM